MAPKANVYVATQSFAIEFNGEDQMVLQGKTRVAADHELVEMFPDRFKPVDEGVQFGVEQTTAAPGEQRQAPPTPPAEKPLAKRTKAEIKAYAAEKDIDLGDAETNKQMVAVIEAAEKASE